MENHFALSILGNTLSALAHLAEHINRYVEAGMNSAVNTAKTYAGDLKPFGARSTDWNRYQRRWIHSRVLSPTWPKRASTTQHDCAAVTKAHALRGSDSPTNDKKFKVLM